MDSAGVPGVRPVARPAPGLHDGPLIKDRSRGDWSTRLINGAEDWDDWNGCSHPHRRNGQGEGTRVRPSLEGLSQERRAMVERALERTDRQLGYSQGAETNGYRVDCSGLLSCAWGLPCPGLTTRTLVDSSVAEPIDKADLLPGDALITQGHAVLFAGWSNPEHTEYVAIEDCGPLGAVAHAITYPYPRAADGYRPYRLALLNAGPSTGPQRPPESAPARFQCAAGALFTDGSGRVLLVKPSYKPFWEIPGGCVEEGESPFEACVREVHEELGIRPPIGRALVAEWVEGQDGQGHFLFVFDGGTLREADREAAAPDGAEILAFSWYSPAELGKVLVPALARRVTNALDARGTPGAAYWERGRPRGLTSLSTVSDPVA